MTQSAPYIRQVTELGDSHQVVATEDICNDQGVSLVKQGSRIDSSLYDRLIRHKLLRPIDYSVSVENPVTPLSLVTEAKRMLSNETDLQQAVDSRFIQRDLLSLLGSVHLEPQLGFKLTLCREQSPERYQHMLRVALIALHVASRLHWPTNERLELAAAATFHDLGEMHLDPSLFNGQALNLARRRQIFSHPTIAFLFLKEFPAYHPRVSLAVHQHHERLDGSGYPKGLAGSNVVPAARVIGASELLAVIRLESARKDSRLFSTKEVLAFNTEKFGNDIILPLIEAAKRINSNSDAVTDGGHVNKRVLKARMSLLLEILQEAEGLGSGRDNEMTDFINRQLGQISAMANRCCSDLQSSGDLLALIGDDDIALSELDALMHEMIFLVQSTAREAMRRWIMDEIPAHDREPLSRWLRNAEMALHSAGFRSE